MKDEELEFAVEIARLDVGERKSMILRRKTKLNGSGALARDVMDTLTGKPSTSSAVKAWLSLVERLAEAPAEVPVETECAASA